MELNKNLLLKEIYGILTYLILVKKYMFGLYFLVIFYFIKFIAGSPRKKRERKYNIIFILFPYLGIY